MYFCLGKAVHAAEVSWYIEATPFRFPPACKSKPAALLNFTVVHSKNTSGPCAWAEEPVKVNHIISKHCTCELSFLYIKKKKKMQFEIGKWESHQFAGWKIRWRTRYREPAKPSRGTALLRAIVSLNFHINYTLLPSLKHSARYSPPPHF